MTLTRSSSVRTLPQMPREISTEHFLHITGELTNPALLESSIKKHAMVHSAIMFGHGRYSAGLLIELKDDFKIDPNDPDQVEDARNRLQLAIKSMNMFAPQHARVQNEMVLFSAPTKPFIYNFSRVNRRDTLAEYNSEINALYKTVARAAQVALSPPKVWSPENSLTYVRSIIVAVLGKKLGDDTDIFRHGVNTFLATRIRTILFHALQSTANLDTRKFSGDLIYQYTTIASLADFATRTALDDFRRKTESTLARYLEMKNTVQAYSLDFLEHQPSMTQPLYEVVLITGTTGLFGSNLLAKFLQCTKTKAVYALNRRKVRSGPVVEKQASIFESCGLDPALARHPKLIVLEADASQSYLGLPRQLYEQLLASVTHIVHNAWLSAHDDNLSLGIFDISFRMLRNLVDFALSSPHSTPPRLQFISTTDTLQGTLTSRSGQAVISRGPLGASDAAGSAYRESKWVGEQILADAASDTPLRPVVVRVGPLCGAPNGRWREEALLPTIVHVSTALGALPQVDEVVHWVPVHIAAQAVVEMRHSTLPYLHIMHPQPVSSLTLLRCIGEELSLPVIPLLQWITLLEEQVYMTSHASSMDDPALTMLQHIHRARAQDPDVPPRMFDHVPVAASRAGFATARWQDVDALGIDDVRRWLQHWREVGITPLFVS